MVMSLATATFTPEEENLIQLLQPTNPVDSTWINEADILISGNFYFFRIGPSKLLRAMCFDRRIIP